MMVEVDWRTTFIDYIKDQVLPSGIKKNDAEAIRIMRRSKNYVLIDHKPYKRGTGSGILMKYVTAEEGKEIPPLALPWLETPSLLLARPHTLLRPCTPI